MTVELPDREKVFLWEVLRMNRSLFKAASNIYMSKVGGGGAPGVVFSTWDGNTPPPIDP